MLAAAGVTSVSVHARPRVTVLSTGDEVVPPETAALRPGQVRDATAVALAAMVTQAGGAGLRRHRARRPVGPGGCAARRAAGQ